VVVTKEGCRGHIDQTIAVRDGSRPQRPLVIEKAETLRRCPESPRRKASKGSLSSRTVIALLGAGGCSPAPCSSPAPGVEQGAGDRRLEGPPPEPCADVEIGSQAGRASGENRMLGSPGHPGHAVCGSRHDRQNADRAAWPTSPGNPVLGMSAGIRASGKPSHRPIEQRLRGDRSAEARHHVIRDFRIG